jgi:hypothetical protein
MATDAAFYEVLENDLRALSAEARKTDSLATQITGWLQHTDFPQIKESAERAVLKLRAVAHEGRGVEAVRTPVGDLNSNMCRYSTSVCPLLVEQQLITQQGSRGRASSRHQHQQGRTVRSRCHLMQYSHRLSPEAVAAPNSLSAAHDTPE